MSVFSNLLVRAVNRPKERPPTGAILNSDAKGADRARIYILLAGVPGVARDYFLRLKVVPVPVPAPVPVPVPVSRSRFKNPNYFQSELF